MDRSLITARLCREVQSRPTQEKKMRLQTLAALFGFKAQKRLQKDSLHLILAHLRASHLSWSPATAILEESDLSSMITLVYGRTSPSSETPLFEHPLLEAALALAESDHPFNESEAAFLSSWLVSEAIAPDLPSARSLLAWMQQQRSFRGLQAFASFCRANDSPLRIWTLLTNLASCDGPLHLREKAFLYSLADLLALSDHDLRLIEPPPRSETSGPSKPSEPSEASASFASSGRPGPSRAASSALHELRAYLGQGRPPEDVKKIKQRLALLLHPDRHPPSLRTEAEELYKLLLRLQDT